MKKCPDDAVLLHILRVSNITEPLGTWNRKLWIPDPLYEERECCTGIPRDIRAPYTVRHHCCMIHHVCALLEVDLELAQYALEEGHWRTLRRLLLLAREEVPLVSLPMNPTVREYAPTIIQYAHQFAHQFSTDELKTLGRWISRYHPEAAGINWDATCAYQALKQ